MAREIQDAQLRANIALPNAANTTTTGILDLGATTPFPVTERIGVKLITTVATGANSKNINVYLQHSAESNMGNAVNIPTLGQIVTTGNAANHIASESNITLPPGTLRYIWAKATGEANGGDSSDGTFSLQLRF